MWGGGEREVTAAGLRSRVVPRWDEAEAVAAEAGALGGRLTGARCPRISAMCACSQKMASGCARASSVVVGVTMDALGGGKGGIGGSANVPSRYAERMLPRWSRNCWTEGWGLWSCCAW